MGKRLPPLKSLRAFEAAARHLSFTKAADELFVTQAAVSHQIKSLEEFLGVPLFVRRNRKLLLTDEGQNYWPKIRDIFETLSSATEQIKAQGASGALTVSVVPTFATVWLVPRLSHFSQIYPEIEVRLKASDDTVDFVREDVDVAIYYDTGDYPGVHSVTLLSERLTPLCSPALLEGNKPLKSPQDLKHHTLLHDGSTGDWRRWLKFAGVKGINLNHGPVFSHTSMVQQAAIYGQGIAMGHLVLSQADVQAGRLVRPFELMMESDFSYDIVCPKESAERPKIKAFTDWLLQTVRQESGNLM
ncbi:transcriptional regulator GcvA [Aliikangiella coralliicola]|uniref:Transcriptional regulator GcvA n=1 Tax=Aliikangiella coralliicola TaxID=2592383 RepID=A0A545UJZ5_9GAMM|nr:transcriptional regulator GcvA [Aliikangiella coralliicola]TQV89781.1 transcriptional regulator GcvA [Aliikangiella coralliicola]